MEVVLGGVGGCARACSGRLGTARERLGKAHFFRGGKHAKKIGELSHDRLPQLPGANRRAGPVRDAGEEKEVAECEEELAAIGAVTCGFTTGVIASRWQRAACLGAFELPAQRVHPLTCNFLREAFLCRLHEVRAVQ